MGFCYPTGKLVNGHWVFLKCDGRSTVCAQDGSSPPGSVPTDRLYRCRDCVEWCSSWTKALEAMRTLDKIQGE